MLTPLRDFLCFGKDVPEQDAEEMAADVLVAVHGSLKDFRYSDKAKLTTWIFKIAKNRAIDYYRKSRPEFVELPDDLEAAFNGRKVQFPGRNQELLLWLQSELDKLSGEDQNILKWRALDFPYALIAEWLGMGEGAARVRHNRAMTKLVERSSELLKGVHSHE